MGRIVVTEFVSLDGVMQAPGGGEDFKYAGWTFEINRGEGGDRFKDDELRDAEALLLGRVTYEGFAKAWPSRKGADKFNRMPKYVVTTAEMPSQQRSQLPLRPARRRDGAGPPGRTRLAGHHRSQGSRDEQPTHKPAS